MRGNGRVDAVCWLISLCVLVSWAGARPAAAETAGYYRFPSLHGDTLVFTSEGDLWTVGAEGGEARRLTSHPGQETHPALSPDGTRVAFVASYEGPTDVYVMPLAGGLPRRLTWDGGGASVAGWTPAGEVLYATRSRSTLPQMQLAAVPPDGGRSRLVPLAQASEGVYEPSGETLYFTRLPFHGSHTKRYRGGTAQQLWRFTRGEAEAVPLVADYPGTSRSPMWWRGRLYFVSDRDGTLNLWSMTPAGEDLTQHTHHAGWDVKSPSLSEGRIVYQLGADLHLMDLADGRDRKLPITLPSDFDQRREHWVDEPMDYLTSAHLSPAGDRVALTARGEVFVAPVKQGRLVQATRTSGVRYRNARFLPGGEELGVLSDESGEVELWTLDARGTAPAEQLTEGGTVLRFDTYPSPDGRHIAYIEKDGDLWLLEVASKRQRRLATSPFFGFGGVSWSPDSRWLAYSVPAANLFSQIKLYDVEEDATLVATSDRFDSTFPAFSPDGQWLYFLSERNLQSVVRSPWGAYQPGPFLNRTTKIYQLALRKGLVSPFAPANELMPEEQEGGEEGGKGAEAKGEEGEAASPPVVIDAEGLTDRLWEVPVPAGNDSFLAVTKDALFWLDREATLEAKRHLMAVEIQREKPEPKRLVEDVQGYELAAGGEKILLRKGDALYVVDAVPQPQEKLGEAQVPLAGWSFAMDPREEWRQMFVEAWRLFRDYFYDPGMHGVDWAAVKEKYQPLVDRVTDRAELSDLLGEMSGELSALHHFVRGGDLRQGPEQIEPASLGAVLERDEAAGGYRVAQIYVTDPDLPEERSPLARPSVDVAAGAVIQAIDGVETLSVADPRALLRNKAGRQVLLRVADAPGAAAREVIVEPLAPGQAYELRYDAWEYERRRRVEEASGGEIGYVHLRALGGGNYSEWARHYFPAFKRKGLIIDLRHNRGGNIDSWILGSLVRKPWMWWAPRHGQPYRNMQYAFGGHMVVLVDEFTASDGEAFAEGFRRLGLGKVIGTRTWGGEIWLTGSNVLVDRGIASAAEFGVYGPEGEWLIEGHGVEPDVVVDNLPHATFQGGDAQLEAAVEHLQQLIRDEPPVLVPEPPPHPNKALAPPS